MAYYGAVAPRPGPARGALKSRARARRMSPRLSQCARGAGLASACKTTSKRLTVLPEPWRANGPDAEARRKRIFNADGHFAKDISNHVGPPGRRAIHSPGPLLWHL